MGAGAAASEGSTGAEDPLLNGAFVWLLVAGLPVARTVVLEQPLALPGPASVPREQAGATCPV